jgi:hypothetical protein
MKRGRIGDVERSIHPGAWGERSDALASKTTRPAWIHRRFIAIVFTEG